MPKANLDSLQSRLTDAKQEHLLEDWNELNAEQEAVLVKDIEEFDWAFVSKVFAASVSAAEAPATGTTGTGIQPCNDILRLQDGTPEERHAWREHGLDLIAQGKAAVLLLAGGQGTRLGSALPKGCYDIGLPSHRSLFQIQAERLLKLQQLAAAHAASKCSDTTQGGSRAPPLLRWIIMTSPFTHDDTLAHFKDQKFFGLQEKQVTFFQQGSLPCLTEQGRAIMSSSHTIAKAPDGNGGVYMSLLQSGVLDLLDKEGVEALDCYCVDNALARLGDPLFLGYCHKTGAQVGARVVAKSHPEERVGVFAVKGNATCVIEYSEMTAEQATSVDPDTGRLLYNWSNICMHYFNTKWLRQVVDHLQKGAAYHIARKKIPSKNGPVDGIKLELFIFDTFQIADKVLLMEVDRTAEFAPVKNAPGSATDSPDTARAAVLALGAQWVSAAGGVLSGDALASGVEVSPLVSYSGEGLDDVVAGKTIKSSDEPSLQTITV